MQISELLARVQHHHDEAHAEIERLRGENELHRQRVKKYFLSKFPQCSHVVFPTIRDLTPGEHLVSLIVIEESSGCTLCGMLPANRLL